MSEIPQPSPAASVDATPETPPSLGKRILDEIKFFAGVLSVVFVLVTFVWGHFKIPSESMLPTLEVGDHIFVSKHAYGYSRHSLPVFWRFSDSERQIFSRAPKPGDVAVFRHPYSDLIMIKRVVALGGDTVQVTNGQLFINGEIVPRTNVDNYLYREHKGLVAGVDVYEEKFDAEKNAHLIYERTDSGPLDNTRPFVVPQGHVFFMGDNRDNSIDSRAPSGPGFVPQSHLIGRAELMMFSFKKCETEVDLRCPPFRALIRL